MATHAVGTTFTRHMVGAASKATRTRRTKAEEQEALDNIIRGNAEEETAQSLIRLNLF